jgi:hypothetical protein
MLSQCPHCLALRLCPFPIHSLALPLVASLFLCSYAANFVSSFQGSDPTYLQASSCW